MTYRFYDRKPEEDRLKGLEICKWHRIDPAIVHNLEVDEDNVTFHCYYNIDGSSRVSAELMTGVPYPDGIYESDSGILMEDIVQPRKGWRRY